MAGRRLALLLVAVALTACPAPRAIGPAGGTGTAQAAGAGSAQGFGSGSGSGSAEGSGAGSAAPIVSSQPVPQVDVTPGYALVVLSVVWPARQVASLAPGTDRIVFELRGGGIALPTIPDLRKPDVGELSRKTSKILPAVPGIEIRATGLANGTVTGQSLWTPLNLRRNARVGVEVELLPATGTSLQTAVMLDPRIDQVSPGRGYPAQTSVLITGANFGFSQGLGAVLFGGVEAGQAQWNDSLLGGATISVQVPPGARTGPLTVRLGGPDSPKKAVWTGTNAQDDPWSGHFTVLGPAGEPFGIDTGAGLVDQALASDGSRFWAVWVKTGGAGQQLLATTLQPDSQTTVSSLAKGTTVQIATAASVKIGGIAPDRSGAWFTWQEGATVKFGHLVAGAAFPDGVGTLSTMGASNARPTIARTKIDGGSMLAAWVDTRDTPAGRATQPRVYTQALSSSGTLLGTSIPAHSPTDPNASYVSNPTVGTNGSSFLVGWQQTSSDAFGLVFQAFDATGCRYYSGLSGWGCAGAGSNEFGGNQPFPRTSHSLEEPRLLFAPQDGEYVVTYIDRLGSVWGTSSDVYMHRLDITGKPAVTPASAPQQIVDDSRINQGTTRCPSYDAGLPCGQGLRHDPAAVWNGRDFMLAWQTDRDDGEVDVQGARIQRTTQGLLLRATEEPASPQPLPSLPRSVAEIIYSFATGKPRESMAGAQTVPRLAWGADAMVVSWIEPKGGESALVVRIWR